MYNQKIMDIFKNPQNVGSMRGANAVGLANDSSCGDMVKIYMLIDEGNIKQVKFQAFGGAGIIAAASVSTKILTGETIDEALEFETDKIVNELGEFPEEKKYCINIIKDAINFAVEDYYKRQARAAKKEAENNF